METMVYMIKITKTVAVSASIASLGFLVLTGCASSKTAGTTPTAGYAAPVAATQPKTLSQTREIPDGGLSPVAEAPQGSSWGGNFLPPGN
jgi:hypothetical protein